MYTASNELQASLGLDSSLEDYSRSEISIIYDYFRWYGMGVYQVVNYESWTFLTALESAPDALVMTLCLRIGFSDILWLLGVSLKRSLGVVNQHPTPNKQRWAIIDAGSGEKLIINNDTGLIAVRGGRYIFSLIDRNIQTTSFHR